MSNLCGCRGFSGSSACILERFHEGDHSYGNYLEAVVRENSTEIESLRQQLASRDAEIAELVTALEKLACLGNGDKYGNSIGNCIAQDALAKVRKP